MRMRPQKRALVAAPFWAQADWQPNAFSTTELWGNQFATDYVWEGMWLGNRQGMIEPHVDKLQGDHATRN